MRSADRSTCTSGVAPYSRIVVLMTGREHVATLLDCVAGWAQRGARVHVAGLAWVPSDGDAGSPDAPSVLKRIALAATFDAACETLARLGIDTGKEILEADARTGHATTLARAVRASEAELAIGSPLSPVALADSTGCAVLVLPTPYAGRCRVPPQRIFVASDGSAESASGLREAARIAAPGAAVRVGYLASVPVAVRHPEHGDTVVLEAPHEGDGVAHAIVEAARQWRTDLLVLGTRGAHTGGRWRYRSVVADVAQRTVLPLLLVPRHSARASLR